MKTKLISLLLIGALILSLSACWDSSDPGTTDPATNPTVNNDPGSTATATQTKAPETTPTKPPEPEYRLNTDLLSDLGLTYGQIRAKRGEISKTVQGDLNEKYAFKNMPGAYSFVRDEVRPAENSDVCKDIVDIPADEFFIGLSKEIEALDIEKIYGIKYLGSVHGYGMDGEFCYSHYTDGKKFIVTVVTTKTDGRITSNSTVIITDNIYQLKLNYGLSDKILVKYQFLTIGKEIEDVGIPKETTIKTLIEDLKSWREYITVKKDGVEVKEGLIEPGMTIEAAKKQKSRPTIFNVIPYID